MEKKCGEIKGKFGKFWRNYWKFWDILRNFGRFGHNLRAIMQREIETKKYICGEKMTNMRSDPMCILAVVVVVVRNPARLCLPPTIAQMPREPQRLIVCRGFLLLRATKQLLQTQMPGSGSRQ